VVFTSALEALACAVAMQQAVQGDVTIDVG